LQPDSIDVFGGGKRMGNLGIQAFEEVDALSSSDFEFFVKEVLESAGWSDLQITALGDKFKHGDGGIDIIGYRDNTRYAFEVKQRSNSSVDVSALNQLNTGAELYSIKHKVLITNSSFTGEVQRRADQLNITLIDRAKLRDMWLRGASDMGRRLRPHQYQVAVIEQVLSGFKQGQARFLVEMATGLGKTYTAGFLTKQLLEHLDLANPKVLWLAHQRELLEQAKNTYRNIFKLGYTYSKTEDGVRPQNTNFVFALFQTLHKHLNEIDPQQFDIILVDEAHHTAARTFESAFGHFDPTVAIGLSATPYRFDGEDIITRFFGGASGHVGRYDLVWAIRNRKLAFPKYRVMIDDLDEEALALLSTGAAKKDIDRKLFLQKKDETIVAEIEKALAESKIEDPKVVIYCKSIKHMENFILSLPAGSATYVHGKMGVAHRAQEIFNFQVGLYKYLLVVDLFNEGIDIPEINALVFLRSTKSPVIWHQQLGRGLRRTRAKKEVLVLDFVGSLEALTKSRAFLETLTMAPGSDRTKRPHDEGEAEADIQDASIEVTYSQEAVQLFELLETHQVQSLSKSAALRVLKTFHTENGYVPQFEDLISVCDEITADQISNLFGSYFAYVREAGLLTREFSETLRANLKEVMDVYFAIYKFPIDKKTLAAESLEIDRCSEFRESDLAELFPDYRFADMQHQGQNEDESAETSPGTLVVDNIDLDQYRKAIRSFADLARLPRNVKQAARDRYGSELEFYKAAQNREGQETK